MYFALMKIHLPDLSEYRSRWEIIKRTTEITLAWYTRWGFESLSTPIERNRLQFWTGQRLRKMHRARLPRSKGADESLDFPINIVVIFHSLFHRRKFALNLTWLLDYILTLVIYYIHYAFGKKCKTTTELVFIIRKLDSSRNIYGFEKRQMLPWTFIRRLQGFMWCKSHYLPWFYQ